MELIKKNIHMDRIRTEAVTQATLEDDRNIPDSRPDVGSISLDKAEVIIEEIKPGTDTVNLKGWLHYDILYHTLESGGSLVPFDGDILFDERINLKGVAPMDTVTAGGEVEDFSVGIINSRKLSLRSLVTLRAAVEELQDEEMPIGIYGEEALEYRKTPLQLAQIVICKNDIFRIKDEAALPSDYPNISQILWNTVGLGDVEFKITDEKLLLQGDVHLFVLYEGEGEDHPIRSFETVLPFSGMLECHGCREGMLPDIRYSIGQQELSLRPDLDGEERCIGLELVMDIAIRIYDEEETEVISDIYGVTKEVSAETHRANLRRVLSCVSGKTKVADHIRIAGGSAPILQLLHSEARVCQERQETVENGILLQGSMQVKVLYITGDDENPYACAHADIPYHYTLDVPGIAPQDRGTVPPGKIHVSVEQLQVTMLDGEEMDVKGVLCFSTVVFQSVPVDLINKINVAEPDRDVIGSLPGMVIYMVKPGDNLWNIGKKYYVPVESLRELNGLESDELHEGQKILIVKGSNG